MMNDTQQRVVIIGRMNVGKSTLFNRLSTSVKSIALDVAGVTRDFMRDMVHWRGRDFELIDTGGISIKESADELTEKVRQRALMLVDEAAVILFVVDGTVGPQPEEYEIARLLHKKKKQVILVLNKADAKEFQDHRYEFDKFGFSTAIAISAEHGTGINDLLDVLLEALPAPRTLKKETPAFKVVFLGRPNVLWSHKELAATDGGHQSVIAVLENWQSPPL